MQRRDGSIEPLRHLFGKRREAAVKSPGSRLLEGEGIAWVCVASRWMVCTLSISCDAL